MNDLPNIQIVDVEILDNTTDNLAILKFICTSEKDAKALNDFFQTEDYQIIVDNSNKAQTKFTITNSKIQSNLVFSVRKMIKANKLIESSIYYVVSAYMDEENQKLISDFKPKLLLPQN